MGRGMSVWYVATREMVGCVSRLERKGVRCRGEVVERGLSVSRMSRVSGIMSARKDLRKRKDRIETYSVMLLRPLQ